MTLALCIAVAALCTFAHASSPPKLCYEDKDCSGDAFCYDNHCWDEVDKTGDTLRSRVYVILSICISAAFMLVAFLLFCYNCYLEHRDQYTEEEASPLTLCCSSCCWSSSRRTRTRPRTQVVHAAAPTVKPNGDDGKHKDVATDASNQQPNDLERWTCPSCVHVNDRFVASCNSCGTLHASFDDIQEEATAGDDAAAETEGSDTDNQSAARVEQQFRFHITGGTSMQF